MKVKKAIVRGSLMVLVIYGSGVFADPPGKEERTARKEQMKYEREQRKRDREWERDERKHYEKLERGERKHEEKMAREERKYQERMWSDGEYPLEQPGYEYGVDESFEPDYVEDKVYRIIKDLRDLTDTGSH